ncbi:DUF6284 family protein [Actinoplanes sp. NPDC026623]|uniref:DUF6284 family protein n=1 Tax=Actinoplanes sp. NPDC026623 TaxID=3155610 RepID=UPI0034116D72
MLLNLNDNDADEPTPDDLAAIDAEQPLITAELMWLNAEITMLNADERGGPSPLDWRRLRRAEARVIRETFAYVARSTARSSSPRAA